LRSDKLKIVLAETEDFSGEVLELLNDHFDVEIKNVAQESLGQTLENCDIFWFRLAFQIGENCISDRTRCRYLVSPVTGIDHIDEEICAANNIRIVCLRGEQQFLREVRATAELTVALCFTLLRRIPGAVQDTLEGNWNRDQFRGGEIFGKTIGVIGLGRLGSITAEYFSALGANVIGIDPSPVQEGRRFNTEKDICSLVQKSDIVSVHVNYTKATRHLLNEAVFKLFTQGKWLINTSRGGVIDEKALLNKLQRGEIAGAALDVLEDEANVSKSNPLIKYASHNENLVITPHIGGNTYESFDKTERFIAEKLIGLVVK